MAGDISEAFAVNHGVKQGFVFSPTLYTLYLAEVLETMGANLNKGVFMKTRSDGKLFNLSTLKASSKTRELCVRNGDALKKSSHFTYLGSAVTDTNSADVEVERRTQAAAKAFGSLQKRLWSQHDIKRKTKVKVYNAAILSSLLYSVESMTLYQRHIQRLTRSQIGHLRQIQGI